MSSHHTGLDALHDYKVAAGGSTSKHSQRKFATCSQASADANSLTVFCVLARLQVRPVAGLMHPRDFLNGLAFKYFHSTQVMLAHNRLHRAAAEDCMGFQVLGLGCWWPYWLLMAKAMLGKQFLFEIAHQLGPVEPCDVCKKLLCIKSQH